MKKFFWLLLVMVFSLSLISASSYEYKEKITSTKYYPRDDVTVSVTRYASYDNEDRYSTYDYRHGYSYRTTESYWDEHYRDGKKINRYKRDSDCKDSRRYSDESDRYYRRYVPHLRSYEKVKCYDSPPADRLFYIRCP
jgi:hypothetical protein